ncbi:unnamed protein product [Trifolium pratense]|uniref:Uncharacterized protein n=1 Tax=Trifolium pratense TaxID=57577 RepID=A0ACB0LM63_TRIPR|nr:unnamed protein product [Trifolium pratense]
MPSFKTTCRQQYFSNKKCMRIKRRPTFGPQIIVPYDPYNPALRNLTIIDFPQNPTIRIDDPMDASFSVGNTYLAYVNRGLVFMVGNMFHRVGNPARDTLSNRSDHPLIIEGARHFLGYDAVTDCYKMIRFTDIVGEVPGTQIHRYTIGSDQRD